MKKVDELRDLARENALYRRLADLGSRIEHFPARVGPCGGRRHRPGTALGTCRSALRRRGGAGQTAGGEDAIIAQYDMIALEKVGMLKMDMLGSRR